MSARRVGGVVAAALFVWLVGSTNGYGQEVPARPRVGLALGGGSARGLAHIGVLRWFDEHRIPIDAIAGTSMGGLLGGNAYLGGWLEAGSAFDAWKSARYQGSAAGGLVMDTLVGPVSLVGAFDLEGRGRVYVAVGTFVHP
jgi:hypothetical protein